MSFPRESANIVDVERRKARRQKPADWESGPKGSDKVGTAGKGNAKASDLESTEEIGSEKDLIESETPKGSARRKATRE
ncbi:hypothetical protein, partial [Streptomyces acidicola]|uniref:hypothetical protein n=1 Tax=Streptomyces acidicola TaxID=2596892 RepID=UPI003815D885